MHDYDDYFEDEESPRVNVDDYEGRDFTSRSFNSNAGKRLNKFPKLSEYTRPHFRPTEKTTSSTSITSSSTTTVPLTIESLSSTSATPTTVSTTREPASTKSYVATTGSADDGANENKKENTTQEAASTEATAASVYTVKEQNFSINEIPEQVDKIEEEQEEFASVIEVSEANFEETSIFNLPGTTELPDDADSTGDLFATPKETTVQKTTSSNEQQEFRPRPEYRPANKPEASFMKGQLYQDAAAKDQQEQPVLKLRGM